MTARPVLAAGGPIAAADAPWWLGAWQSNADLIAEVARLGYLDGRVLDATYGRGTFWKRYRPERLLANDLYLGGADGVSFSYDYREFPIDWVRSFDSVVFDPDYKLNGTPALGEFDDRYGIAQPKTREERYESILAGAVECYRVTRRFLLVKCMDQVESGRQWWMADDITEVIRERGGKKAEEFYYLGGGRPQPADRDKRCAACNGTGVHYEPDPYARDVDGEMPVCVPCDGKGRVPSEQQHAYGRPSKLLIFARPGRKR